MGKVGDDVEPIPWCGRSDGAPLFRVEERWIIPTVRPPFKGWPPCITFSMPVINAAAQVVLVATGSSKKEIIQTALKPKAGQLVTFEAGKIGIVRDGSGLVNIVHKNGPAHTKGIK